MAVVDEGSYKGKAVDWSKLLPELLGLISDRIEVAVDHISFRSVCSSWRSATPERILQPLLAYFTLNDANSTTSFHFFSLRDAELVQVHHDHLLSDLPPNKLCCGSSHGYLALIDQFLPSSSNSSGLPTSLTLFNPITKSRFDLPCYFPPRPHEQPETNRDLLEPPLLSRTKFNLSADPSEDPHFLVVLLYARSLVLWRNGSWREIDLPFIMSCCEDAYFYHGKLVIASYGIISAYNVEQGQFSPYIESDENGHHFFVESTGDLLHVQVLYHGEEVEDELFTCEVFKVVLEEHRLIKVESLGDRALFVGQYWGISVLASEYPRCKANCIYYLPLYGRPPSILVRLSLEDDSNERIVGPFLPDLSKKDFTSSLWLKN